MQSIATIWKQFQPTSSTSIETETKVANDIDNSALKSVIKTRAKTSPTIDVVTHQSQDSIDKSSSLLGLSADFIESSDSLHDIEQHQQKAFSESMENLPTDLLLESSHSLDLSSFAGGPSTAEFTCASQYHDKWPIPDTIEQVHQLVETEQAEGSPASQLELCLHLMESAWQVDPNNRIKLAQEEKPAHSTRMLDDIMMNLKLTAITSNANSTTAATTSSTTLGEAMVMEAKKLLKQLAHSNKGAGQGAEAEAQFLLGNCYGIGALGWPLNHKRAFQWYLQASKYGHPEATYRTAVCYEIGIGTSKDGSCALTFYRKAAHLMHVPAMYKLGVILMRGYCDHPISRREAVVWLQRAACTAIAPLGPTEKSKATTIGGHAGIALPHALHALAIVHLTRECERTSMIPDPKYAIKLLHNAARLGYAPSQSKLGECYECGYFCPEDESQSIYWYSLAAQQDYPEACLALSGWYLTGSLQTKLIAQSDQEAYLWARKAAKLSKHIQPKSLTAKAYYTLGIYHQHGIGTPKSVDIANKWYKKAAYYGHPEAIKMNLL
ncbi:HCP-like protein [Mucor ambiguus]|uniref:HCP-like protein n=1 Tax=Mucor ambiguus TaxID=91626 RepID=A0A0C9LV47_9FUNG|nr:HCP-like protein [Mucor ambiguus]